ncbi:MAG TPA: CAP domain-containing protein [Micromonosporaceae bacterium]|nr:CAP domain-containing protein [Micromonosporaceae bacterium]
MAVLIGALAVGARIFAAGSNGPGGQGAGAGAGSDASVTAEPSTDIGPSGSSDAANPSVSAIPAAGAASPAGTPTAAAPPTAAPPAATPRVGAPRGGPAQPVPPAKPRTTPARPAPNTAPAGAADQESAVLALVNAARAEVGCGPLAMDARLTAAARGHSADMANRNFFAHETPDKVGMAARVTKAGYQWSAVAENIAMGQSDAAAVMKGWMNSPGHRTNILNCRYRHIGIGMVANSAGRRYWTQNFATPA